MKDPKVSVVIPAYNHERFVRESIQSVLDQTFQDFELIIINDGSTDHTEDEILRFKDPRIRYYSQENRGLSATLNRGIELARGEYFNFLPSDDAFLPEKLEVQLNLFEKDPGLGLVFAYPLLIDAEGREIKEDSATQWAIVPYEIKEEIFPALFERNFLSAPSALIKKECFQRVGMFDESLQYAQDYDMWMRILKYYDLRLIKQPLLKYRWHGANLTFQATPATEMERTKVLLKAYKDLTIEDIFPSLRVRKDALAYDRACEKLASYMERSGIPALLPISQIYRDLGKTHSESQGNPSYSFAEELIEGSTIESLDKGSRKIKILIETSSLDKGGMEEVIFSLTTHLDPDLFYPIVVCIERGGFTADRIKKRGIPVEILGQDKEKEYIEILHHYQVDLVNSHYSFFGSKIARQHGIPVVSVLHNLYSWYTGSILDEFRVVDQYVSKYVAVSKQVASFFKYRFNIDPKKIQVIHNGIDPKRFKEESTQEKLNRKAFGLEEEDFIFLHVGAITPAKMQNLLVSAMKEISKNYPNVKLISIGSILDEDYFSFIQKKVEENQLGDYLKLIGFVEDLSPYYRLADAFVLPSLIEGWSIATLEAMYYNLPLILTKVGGAEELIENQDIGLLIENCCEDILQLSGPDLEGYSHLDFPSNTHEFIEAMLNIYRNREEWKEKAKQGRNKIISQYTWEKIIPKYQREFLFLAIEGGRKRRSILEGKIREQMIKLEEQKSLIEKQGQWKEELQNRIDRQEKEIRDQLVLINQQLDNVIRRLSITERIRERYLKLLKKIHEIIPIGRLFFMYMHKVLSILRREGLMGLKDRIKRKVRRRKFSHFGFEFNPYNKLRVLNPIEVVLIEKDYSEGDIGEYPKFSVVVPVKNEEETIKDLLDNFKDQIVKPDEIIFIDDSSTDRTFEIIESYQKKHQELPIKLFKSSNNSLAKNRNWGLNLARNEIIIFIDAGNKFENSFLLNLIGAYKEHPDADLITGIYKPLKKTNWSYKFVWDWDYLDFKEFLPSTKVLLIKKKKALEIGGFPKFLPYTGEDTLFAINYRKVSHKWVFNKKVVVYWDAPKNKEQALKKAYLYGKGDGENGYGDFRFYENLVRCLRGEKVDFEDKVNEESFKGYLAGRKNRLSLWQRESSILKNFLLFSGIPFSDSGGGQRGTQIALELMKKNCKVTFCSVYPSFEKEIKVYLNVELPLLELWYFEHFNLEDYLERHKEVLSNTVVLLEFPHPEFIIIVDKLKKICPEVRVIYDCIDNWDSDLGWIWYSREKELEIILKADFIITSAGTLKARLEKMTNKPIYTILNAVNTHLFNPKKFPMIYDLPLDKPLIMYIGALWGKWFDWELIYYASQNLPEFNFVLIGDIPQDKRGYFKSLSNVKMLGLKPQFELPKYLAYASVCIVPFRYDENIVRYTNPLKVYEYLAMGKPVVSTFIDEIESLPGVVIASNKEAFVNKIKELVFMDSKCNIEWSDFIRNNHSWTQRVSNILKILERQ